MQIKLPQDTELEKVVLSTMMNSQNALNYSCDIMNDNDFCMPDHKIIFNACKEMYLSNSAVDANLLVSHLNARDELAKMGGAIRIFTLSELAPMALNFEHYANELQSITQLRKLTNICLKGLEKVNDQKDSFVDILESLQKDLHSLEFKKNKDPISIGKIIEGQDGISLIQKIEKAQECNRNGQIFLPGIPTGWNQLDQTIGGFVSKHLIILGARPSVGKTTFALNILLNFTMKLQRPAAFFSLEMSAEEVTEKMVCLYGQLSHDLVRKGIITSTEFATQLLPAAENLKSAKLIIDDAPSTLGALRSKARRLKEAFNIELLVIDYLGLIQGPKSDNKQSEISQISISLKALAKEIDVPILCLCQLNRRLENEKRSPNLSDLRDSGQIEADADEVLLLHRPEVISSMDKPGCLQVIVAKNRYGSCKMIEYVFNGKLGLIQEICKRETAEQIKKVTTMNYPYKDELNDVFS
jgi:replicative DNA helicase